MNSGGDDNDDDHDDWPRHLTKTAVVDDGGGRNVRHRGGWQGEEMEMEHQRLASANNIKSNTHAAVDLNQFRNTIVGEGYQAKHVIRQRTAGEPVAASAASAAATSSADHRSSKKSRTASSADCQTTSKDAVPDRGIDLQTLLLQNDGIRTFVKEINDILSSPS